MSATDSALLDQLEQQLLQCLLKLAVADAAQLDRLCVSDHFHQNEGDISFKLQGLYAYAGLNSTLSYAQFRQLLYQTQLNQRLAEQGYHIDIAQNNGKVDETYYQLIAL